MRMFLAGVLMLVAPAVLVAQAPEAVIHVAADKTAGPVSRYLTGACIEDVNHEIYGGLYAVKGAASGITSLAAHRQILEPARCHRREVWFDIHVDTDDPKHLGEVAVVPSYVEALAKLSGGARRCRGRFLFRHMAFLAGSRVSPHLARQP